MKIYHAGTLWWVRRRLARVLHPIPRVRTWSVVDVMTVQEMVFPCAVIINVELEGLRWWLQVRRRAELKRDIERQIHEGLAVGITLEVNITVRLR